MFPQYQMIRDFDLYEKDEQEFTRFSAPVFHKDDFLKQTQDNELQTLKLNLTPRSLKSKSLAIQTSFEQNSMEQHSSAFKKTLQKYMEKCYPTLKKAQGSSLTNEIFQIEQDQASAEQKIPLLLINDKDLFEEKEKKQFLTDLHYEEKLNEFLTTICASVPSQLALELIFIANIFWQAYVPKQQLSLSEAEIKTLVNELLESPDSQKYMERIKFINFKAAQMSPEVEDRQVDHNMKNFMRQYGNTILLVVQQYFQNPYSKEFQGSENMKRSLNFKDISNDQFSEDEDQINFSLGNKKRKM